MEYHSISQNEEFSADEAETRTESITETYTLETITESQAFSEEIQNITYQPIVTTMKIIEQTERQASSQEIQSITDSSNPKEILDASNTQSYTTAESKVSSEQCEETTAESQTIENSTDRPKNTPTSGEIIERNEEDVTESQTFTQEIQCATDPTNYLDMSSTEGHKTVLPISPANSEKTEETTTLTTLGKLENMNNSTNRLNIFSLNDDCLYNTMNYLELADVNSMGNSDPRFEPIVSHYYEKR